MLVLYLAVLALLFVHFNVLKSKYSMRTSVLPVAGPKYEFSEAEGRKLEGN